MRAACCAWLLNCLIVLRCLHCRLRRCRGSDLRLPFECPADYVFYTPLMDMQPGLDYRVPGFLEDPRVRWACCARWACWAVRAGGAWM